MERVLAPQVLLEVLFERGNPLGIIRKTAEYAASATTEHCQTRSVPHFQGTAKTKDPQAVGSVVQQELPSRQKQQRNPVVVEPARDAETTVQSAVQTTDAAVTQLIGPLHTERDLAAASAAVPRTSGSRTDP